MSVVEELKSMSEERFLAIYRSLEDRGFGPLDVKVAESLRFRPQAVKKLAMEKRARRARQILLREGSRIELTYELFGTYLVRNHKELVCGFLDRTGVAHEDGMIEDTEEAVPELEKIEPAIQALDQEHAAEDVTLYLALCAEQWPEIERLAELWRGRTARSPT